MKVLKDINYYWYIWHLQMLLTIFQRSFEYLNTIQFSLFSFSCLEEEHAQLGAVVDSGQGEGHVRVCGGAEPLVAIQIIVTSTMVIRNGNRLCSIAHITSSSSLCHPLATGPEL